MAERFQRAGEPGAVAAPHPGDNASIAELVKQASEQTAELVRKEIRLAQLELSDKAKHAGIGLGMFGAAGLIAFFGLGALVATAVLALATAMDAWLAALVVAVVLLAIAAMTALAGRKETEHALPVVPEQAAESVHEDVEEIKRAARR